MKLGCREISSNCTLRTTVLEVCVSLSAETAHYTPAPDTVPMNFDLLVWTHFPRYGGEQYIIQAAKEYRKICKSDLYEFHSWNTELLASRLAAYEY